MPKGGTMSALTDPSVLIRVTRYTAAACGTSDATRIFPADGRNCNTQGLPLLQMPRD
jgi:hypothetical protein